MSFSIHVVLDGGEIPAELVPPELRSTGQNLRDYQALSDLAWHLGLARLDSLMVDSEALMMAEYEDGIVREPRWFDPAVGLLSVRGLIAALEGSCEWDRRFFGAVWDLRDIEYKLMYAEQTSQKFHLA